MLLVTGEGTVIEHVHSLSDGTLINVEVHAYPLKDEDGKTVKMIEFSFDISKRKLALAALRVAKERNFCYCWFNLG